MNIYTLKKLNKLSLTLSKCFYKVGWYTPGRWIGYFRQKRTLPFLESFGKELLEKDYSYDNLEKAENKVFVMWYQGFDQLPPVIEKCIESLKKNIPGKKIVFISRDNMKEYVDLPDYIYEKVDSGKIDKTMFSDITRAALLYKHGGIWADAADLFTAQIDSNYFDNAFYSPAGIITELKKDFRYLFRRTQGWNISFQGSKYKKFPLYDYLYSFYLNFFKIYETNIDYFQTDFTISLFLKHNQKFREIIKAQKLNNTREFDLALMMNKKLTASAQKKLDKLLSENFIHKITYKKNWEKSRNGIPTVYGKLLFPEETK